jgi:DNA-binding CsgD family transcriptional regulator
VQLGLTPREGEVLHWVAEGKSNTEIGAILGLNVRTVEKHLQSIFAQLDVQNRAAAVTRVMERFGRPGA